MIRKRNENIVSVKEAAEVIGISEVLLRVGLQDTESPWHDIGYAYRKPGSKNHTYGVFRSKLEEFVGKSVPVKHENDTKLIEIQTFTDDAPVLKRA